MRYNVVIWLSCLSLALIHQSLSAAKTNRPLVIENFSNGEANFKFALEKLEKNYIDTGVSRDELYRAATEGMLRAFNSEKHPWNQLLTPVQLRAMQSDMSGEVVGIGVEMKFNQDSGFAEVLRVVEGSPAARAGLKVEDQIIAVDGKKFKGRPFTEIVNAVRGPNGSGVNLKILREDKVLNSHIKREKLSWAPVAYEKINPDTGYLMLGYFNEQAPMRVKRELRRMPVQIKNLVIDLRGNSGGSFEHAVEVGKLFSPPNTLVAVTRDRSQQAREYKSGRQELRPDLRLVVMADSQTSSGAELFVSVLKELRKAPVIGERTFGKWNAQMVERLPNQYAIKYTVSEFYSPHGQNYSDVGIQPDIPVSLKGEMDARELYLKYKMQQRIQMDSQLKAALGIL